MSNFYEWFNREKSRYYKIAIKKIAHDEIVLSHDWGSCISNRGGKKDLHVSNDDELNILINSMMKRRKSRGYELISPSIN